MTVNPNQHTRTRNGKAYIATNPNGIIEDNISYQEKFGEIKIPGIKKIKDSIKDGSAKRISDYLDKHNTKKYDYTDKILGIFDEAGKYFERLSIKKYYNPKIFFETFAEKIISDYNLKDDLYNFNETEDLKDKNGNTVQRFIYIKGFKVSLDALGNMLYGYCCEMANIPYTISEFGAFVATLRKFNGNFENSENNETPDRELYKAGYKLAEEIKENHGKINADILLKHLKPAYEKSLKIETILDSPVVDYKSLQDKKSQNKF